MVELRLPPVPADLKHVLPFLQRAQEVRARDPVVCYWSLYYVARLGMQRAKTQESQAYLAAVLEHLEGMKRSLKSRRQITDEAAGSQHIRRFGFSVFEAAKNEDALGQATRATAKKFLAASYFLEILRAFGPLDGEVEETIKYAKFKAADIVRILREATTPAQGAASVPNQHTANGGAFSPSTLSPQQTNPGSLSGRPSTFQSPVESPTGAPHRAFSYPQPNRPPPPPESGGSGSAPVSPHNAPSPNHSPFRSDAPRQLRTEQILLPNHRSGMELRSPEATSPRKLQSPIRSPLAVNGTTLSRDATPINRAQPLPSIPKSASPLNPRTSSPANVKVASPVKRVQEMPPAPVPVIQQPLPQWPPANFVLTRPGDWNQQALVSPSMHSTLSVDSTETFTSSQLRAVIKSGSAATQTAPRATSPVKTESVASTSQQSESQESESATSSEEESVAESTFIPVLTVVDDMAAKVEVPPEFEGTPAGGLVAVASPAVDDWSFEREMSEAIGRLTRKATTSSPARVSNTDSPLSWACKTPIPESPDAALQANLAQTPAQATRQLGPSTTSPGPTVVIPQSPAQPSPTTPSMLSPYSPSPTSPTSMMLNQSFKSAAELIDMQFSKVYVKYGSSREADVVAADDENMDAEVESGSSGSYSSGSGSEIESDASEDKGDRRSRSTGSSASEGSDSEGGSSVVSEMTIMSARASVQGKGEQNHRTASFELKSLIKNTDSNGGVQTEAVVVRKTVRFAPSVVGGLSPEIPKQILPAPPPLLIPPRSSPPLQIIPASAVTPPTQPLIRPKSLTVRSNSYDSYHSTPQSPDSPSYGPARAAGMVGYVQPQEEFAIIPFHPSMSASHPPPALHNNPTYTPAVTTRTLWNSSPPQTAQRRPPAIDRDTAALAQKYSRFAISSLNYMDIETAKKELRAALSLLEGETY